MGKSLPTTSYSQSAQLQTFGTSIWITDNQCTLTEPDRYAEPSGFSVVLVSNDQTEAWMHRLIAYRGFEIHVELTPAAEDTFDVTVQIKGGNNLEVLGARGGRVPLRNGPFTERWAYLVGEIAGQAAIDVLLGPVQ